MKQQNPKETATGSEARMVTPLRMVSNTSVVMMHLLLYDHEKV